MSKGEPERETMKQSRSPNWGQGRTLLAAVLLVIIPSAVAVLAAPYVPEDLRKSLYAGAVTLFFGGLLGGMLKVLLDDVVAAKRKREDAAAFVMNVLADLKSVYDRVALAKILIPAHRSVKTYGEEMRALIESRVQLRNVVRALEQRAEGVDQEVRSAVTRQVQQMESYLKTLTLEFRDNYKALSDQQRGYEERAKVLLENFAKALDQESPPELPGFVWGEIARLPKLSDFVGEAKTYESEFEESLNEASRCLRNELARILGRGKRR
jgi:hypothetical protein